MIVAALFGFACVEESLGRIGPSTLRQRETQPLRCHIFPSNLFEAGRIRNEINAHVLNIKRKEDIKRHV